MIEGFLDHFLTAFRFRNISRDDKSNGRPKLPCLFRNSKKPILPPRNQCKASSSLSILVCYVLINVHQIYLLGNVHFHFGANVQ